MNLNSSSSSRRHRQARKMIEGDDEIVQQIQPESYKHVPNHDDLNDHGTSGIPVVEDNRYPHSARSSQSNDDASDAILSSLFPEKSKPSLLCLHGYKSNGQITTLQLENLTMAKDFDVHVLHGPLESDTPAEPSMALLSSGPYYSWMQMDSTRTLSSVQENGSGSEVRSKYPNFGAIFDGMHNQQYNGLQSSQNSMDYLSSQRTTTHVAVPGGKTTYGKDPSDFTNNISNTKNMEHNHTTTSKATVSRENNFNNSMRSLGQEQPVVPGNKDINNNSIGNLNNSSNTSLQIPDGVAEEDSTPLKKSGSGNEIRNLLPNLKKLRRGSSIGSISNDQQQRRGSRIKTDGSAVDDNTRRDSLDPFTFQNTQLRGQFDETMSALRYLLHHLVSRVQEKKNSNSQDNDNGDNNDTTGAAGVTGTQETSNHEAEEDSIHSEAVDDKIPAYDVVYAFSQSASLVSILSNSVMRKRLMKEFGMISPYSNPEQVSAEDIKPWNFIILGCAANSTAYKMIRWYLFEHHVCHPVLVLKRDKTKKMLLELQRRLQTEREEAETSCKRNGALDGGLRAERRNSFSFGGIVGSMGMQSPDATRYPPSNLPGEDPLPVVENADTTRLTEEVPKKRIRRSSIMGVMRRLSATQSDPKVQNETDFDATLNNDDLHKVLAVEEGVCERCGESLDNRGGCHDLIDIPSVQFIGIEDGLKSESEYYLLQYNPEHAMPIYLDSGHEIPTFLKNADSIAEDVMLWRDLKGRRPSQNSEASLTTLDEASVDSGGLSDDDSEGSPPPMDSDGSGNAPTPAIFDGFENAPPPQSDTTVNLNTLEKSTNRKSGTGISNSEHSRRRRSDMDISSSEHSRRRRPGMDISNSEHSRRVSRRRSHVDISNSERGHRHSGRRGSGEDISRSEHSRWGRRRRSDADISNSEHGYHHFGRRGSGGDIARSEHSRRTRRSSTGNNLQSERGLRTRKSEYGRRRGSDMDASEHSMNNSMRSTSRSERVMANLQGGLTKIFKVLEDRLDDDDQHSMDKSSRHRRSSIGSVGSMFSRKIGKRKYDVPEDVSLVRVNNDMLYFQQQRKKSIGGEKGYANLARCLVEDELDVPRFDSFAPHGQYFLNHIKFSKPSTLFDLLSEADNPCNPALYSPIEPAYSISYLEILSFIRTNGDLRRLGAKKNSLVAYAPPPGAGGILSALAFLTVASQCTAAPMDPSYSKNDYDSAFEQLNPDIMIIFEPVDPKPVLDAASDRKCKCYIASPTEDGYFTYRDALTRDEVPFFDSNVDDGLVNAAEGVGLLLRTSGTTSKPKVVPLKIGSIVSNARIIAHSLGLQPSDVSLNAMPLFHIGGISANLLSSLASNGACILAETFDADSFNTLLSSKTCGTKPTWFSAVPTMHATITDTAESLITLNSKYFKHSLRFIRSGAAALPHDLALKMESVFGCPVVGTYSMTEQMPISQPHNLLEIRSRSVGKPIATSLCIVDKTLRPLPFGFGQHGEVCISGDPVFEGYQGNDTANMKSFFFIGSMKWFRTGDMGYLDRDGYLFLTGRNKEMIKRGGEQINPLEVEEICKNHPLVKKCVAFAIPDKLWGQRLGLAVVRNSTNAPLLTEEDLTRELKQRVIKQGIQELKAPEKVVFVQEQDIPMTSSKKVIRVGLSEKLGVKPMSDDVMERLQDLKPFPSISEAISGVRFFLALAVLYNHIGDFGYRLNHARLFCLHVPAFFFIGGFILAAGSKNNVIEKADLKGFFGLRLAIIHPMYLVALLFALINFVVRCNPSNYIEDFDPVRQPEEGEHFVCQSTMIEMPYGWAMFSSLFMHIFALQPWPFSLLLSWFILSYPWFQSVYYFCLFCFPWLHRQFHAQRRNKKGLFKHMTFWLCSNYIMVGVFQLYSRLYEYDPNFAYIFSLMAYLFPPGWLPSFALGVGAYFLFALYRPNEKMSVWKWGVATDCLTLAIFAMFMIFAMLPDAVTPDKADSKEEKRYFAYFLSRVTAPITFLWIFGLAVGKGFTARLMSNSFLVTWLAPASYNMYLFHQIIQEWYFVATRGYWWVQPKPYYWFSPYATPVPWWEFFIIAFITVVFSILLEVFVNSWVVKHSTAFTRIILCLKEEKVEGKNVSETITVVIKQITGIDVSEETNLLDTGLSSMTTLLLISDLVKVYPTLKLAARDVFGAKTVKGLVDMVEEHLKESVVPTSGMDGFGIDQDNDNNIRNIHIVRGTENTGNENK